MSDLDDFELTDCDVCNDGGISYWSDGVFGACMECNAESADTAPLVDEDSNDPKNKKLSVLQEKYKDAMRKLKAKEREYKDAMRKLKAIEREVATIRRI
jgi:hypothetical protein